MKRLILAASAAASLLLAAGPATAQVSATGMGKVLPVELFACKYIDGKGRADLDKVVARWSKFMDDNDIDDYAAWLLQPVFFGPTQDFDVVWLGAFRDGNAMGRGQDTWLTKGGEVQAAFDKVVDCNAHLGMSSAMYKAPSGATTPESGFITMMDCKLNEGHRYEDIKAAELKWVQELVNSGSRVGYWHWFPTFGGGDSEFNYKVVSAYESFTEIGADFERFANGGGRERSQEIFGDIDECDDARVYASTTVRTAQIRD